VGNLLVGTLGLAHVALHVKKSDAEGGMEGGKDGGMNEKGGG